MKINMIAILALVPLLSIFSSYKAENNDLSLNR